MRGTPLPKLNGAEMMALSSSANVEVGRRVFNTEPDANVPYVWTGSFWKATGGSNSLVTLHTTIVGNTNIIAAQATPVILLSANVPNYTWIPVEASLSLSGTVMNGASNTHVISYPPPNTIMSLVDPTGTVFDGVRVGILRSVTTPRYFAIDQMESSANGEIVYTFTNTPPTGGDGTTTLHISVAYITVYNIR